MCGGWGKVSHQKNKSERRSGARVDGRGRERERARAKKLCKNYVYFRSSRLRGKASIKFVNTLKGSSLMSRSLFGSHGNGKFYLYVSDIYMEENNSSLLFLQNKKCNKQ